MSDSVNSKSAETGLSSGCNLVVFEENCHKESSSKYKVTHGLKSCKNVSSITDISNVDLDIYEMETSSVNRCTSNNPILSALSNGCSNDRSNHEVSNLTKSMSEIYFSDTSSSSDSDENENVEPPTNNSLLEAAVISCQEELVDSDAGSRGDEGPESFIHLDPSSPQQATLKEIHENQIADELQKCPDCGEVIVEIFNNDITFSLDVHRQIHKVTCEPENLLPKITFDKLIDYMCPDCNDSITLFNNDFDLSFDRHFDNCHLKNGKAISCKERIDMNKTFVIEVFDCLRDNFKINFPFVVFEGESLHCKVCNCPIKTSKDMFSTSVFLQSHLSLNYHKDLLDALTKGDRDNLDKSALDKNNLPSKSQKNIPPINKLKPDVQKQKEESTKATQTKLSSAMNETEPKCHAVDSSSLIKASNNSTDITEKDKSCFGLDKLFKNCPAWLQIHREFFTLSNDGAHCNMCALTIEPCEKHVKSHIINILHKKSFFSKIKGNLQTEQKSHVKFIIVIGDHISCSCCKAFVTNLTSFGSVCEAIVKHCRLASHLACASY